MHDEGPLGAHTYLGSRGVLIILSWADDSYHSLSSSILNTYEYPPVDEGSITKWKGAATIAILQFCKMCL